MTMITSIDISTYMITFFFSMSKEDQLSSLSAQTPSNSWGWGGTHF